MLPKTYIVAWQTPAAECFDSGYDPTYLNFILLLTECFLWLCALLFLLLKSLIWFSKSCIWAIVCCNFFLRSSSFSSSISDSILFMMDMDKLAFIYWKVSIMSDNCFPTDSKHLTSTDSKLTLLLKWNQNSLAHNPHKHNYLLKMDSILEPGSHL